MCLFCALLEVVNFILSQLVEYNTNPDRSVCFPVGVVVFFSVLFAWHHVLACTGTRNMSVFLDKGCIHQTDPVRWSQGIRSIGTILNRVCGTRLSWLLSYTDI